MRLRRSRCRSVPGRASTARSHGVRRRPAPPASAAARSLALSSGSVTTTNVHGCWCAPEGAVPATRSAWSTSSRGTGRLENIRTERRARIRSRANRRARVERLRRLEPLALERDRSIGGTRRSRAPSSTRARRDGAATTDREPPMPSRRAARAVHARREASIRRIPPISPPTWPPTRSPGNANEMTRLIDDQRERLAAEWRRCLPLEHEHGAEDAEDRAGGADGGRGRALQQGTRRACEPGDEVEPDVAPAAEVLLDGRPDQVERVHVHRDVERSGVQEHRGDEPPPVALR